uniref:Ribonuclease H-like domain-containing protein n=1 Tax=Tanacetum cinerariifolium TaxID=118510 RepID=A0A6L2MFK8_TANCI|nr:ribonuclease H-like domain-containing protein [Tanacetum cinerariifolium]
MTHRVLLRCDSTGDLYPVTKPSTIPHAFLTSQYTWHQRLRHPRSEVLRRLLSSNLISCTKEKPTVLFHACQLGKHVRLPFHVVNAPLVNSIFMDLILSAFLLSDTCGNFTEESSTVISYIIRSSPIATDSHHPSPSITLVDTSQPTTPLGLGQPNNNEPTNTDAFQPNNNEPNITEPAAPLTPTISNFKPQPTQNVNPNSVSVHPMVTGFRVESNHETLSRYKARLVVNDSTQLEGVDVDETFSPVVKPGTIWTVFSLATSRHWHVHQLDVKKAFLHGDLSKMVYMHQPLGFQDSSHPDYVCLLQRQGTDTAYLLLYVNDIVLTASSEVLLQKIITSLHQEFSMTDIGSLNYFLDISYAVQQVCLYMHDPREPHFSALNRILSVEAEYRGVANAVAETCWLINLLRALHTPFSFAMLVYCDNVIAVYLSANPVRALHVPLHYQYVDIFTKGLPSALFKEFRTSLSVRYPPVQTAEECYSYFIIG